MKATISKEGIMEVKALVMNRSIFKQLQEIRQKELESIINKIHFLGYVNDSEGLGSVWLIAQKDKTIIRIRETEYFWIFRITKPTLDIKEINKALDQEIHSYQQIFIK